METIENLMVLFLSLFFFGLNSAKGFTISTTRTTTRIASKSEHSPMKQLSLLLPPLANKRPKPSICCKEKPSWLDDAMEGSGSIPSEEYDVESYKNRINLRPGIAGFSVDSDLGFLCVLVAESRSEGKGKDQKDDGQDNNNNDHQYWMPVVISPLDTDRPKSAEALTCVQLAGGLDLGTAVLPPDSLAKLVVEHNAEDEQDDSKTAGTGSAEDNDNEPRPPTRLSLTKITVVPNPDASDDVNINIEEETQEIVPTTPEREQAILDALPKAEKAFKTLPGLQETTTDSVLEAMQRFADSKGAVDRNAFSSILDSLRLSMTPSILLTPPLFRLNVSVIDGNGISQVTVDTTNPMIALGLAMRYKVTVDVKETDQHKEGGNGVDELLERFPAFRPIQELNEDSEIIDGFIPSMFEKAKNIDNDMKGQ